MTLLRLQREPSDTGATLGALYINDVWQCWTLEDAVREQPMGLVTDRVAWVAAWKVRGSTAIPAGQYSVRLSLSQRFNRVLPELLDVPGFAGIRIHAGNTAVDTDGCILVGCDRAAQRVGRSGLALEKLLARLRRDRTAGDDLAIDIVNPPMRHLLVPPTTAAMRV